MDEVSEKFEQCWKKWNIDNTILWFQNILGSCNNNDSSNVESEESGQSEVESGSLGEFEVMRDGTQIQENWDLIKEKMIFNAFSTQEDLPIMMNATQDELLEKYGFVNQSSCELLQSEIRHLIQRYP